jgi:hypothetical protein
LYRLGLEKHKEIEATMDYGDPMTAGLMKKMTPCCGKRRNGSNKKPVENKSVLVFYFGQPPWAMVNRSEPKSDGTDIEVLFQRCANIRRTMILTKR